MYSISNMTLQNLPPNMGMDINNFVSSNVSNYDKVRDYTITFNKNPSKTVSITLSKAPMDYATRMERLNDVSEKTVYKELIDSSQLSYVDNKDIQISRVADYENRVYSQHGSANTPALKSTPTQRTDDDIINIQLPYDINTLTEPEL